MMIIYFLCHDDEIILTSSSLKKQLVDRWRDKSMRAAHIFLFIHGDSLEHNQSSCVGDASYMVFFFVRALAGGALISSLHA
jgi:hypothetical protein